MYCFFKYPSQNHFLRGIFPKLSGGFFYGHMYAFSEAIYSTSLLFAKTHVKSHSQKYFFTEEFFLGCDMAFSMEICEQLDVFPTSIHCRGIWLAYEVLVYFQCL